MAGFPNWIATEIIAWVMAHKEVLTADLETISKYPIPFRKVIVNMMPGDNRIAVWREHLAAAAAADPTLDDAQRAFVAECSANLHSVMHSESARDELAARSMQVLTTAQNSAIFATLGPPEPPGGLPLPPRW